MITILEGMLLGFAYVMPIGAQNLFVIHSSITNKSSDAYKVASLVILMDISLALACYFGIGAIVSYYPNLSILLQIIGGLYLLKIAVGLIRSKAVVGERNKKILISDALRNSFVLTWMNPQALIDGSILLGSFNSKAGANSNSFILGVCLASIVWFYTLTSMMRLFHKKIDDRKFKIINIVCGLILFYLGISLIINAATKVSTL